MEVEVGPSLMYSQLLLGVGGELALVALNQGRLMHVLHNNMQ